MLKCIVGAPTIERVFHRTNCVSVICLTKVCDMVCDELVPLVKIDSAIEKVRYSFNKTG